MRDAPASPGIWDAIWEFFASLRLTVILLLSLAATSIIGTLIPQNASPEEYFRTFGAFWYRLFEVLDLFDMYRSWWFRLLIILVALNIIVCSIERLSTTWKILFARDPKFKRARFEKAANRVTFETPQAPEMLRDPYLAVLKKRFARTKFEATESGVCLFAERWRWTRIGVYIVHLSVVLLLAGSLIGSIGGFEGFVNIPEQEQTDTVFLRQSGASRKLPFSIRCEDFSVSFYETGAPSEFRSRLAIIENGKVVLQKDIVVNDPLRYRGINIFQSSYGKMAPDKLQAESEAPEALELRITRKSSGQVETVRVRIGESLTLPQDWGRLVVREYRPSLTFGGQNLGAGVVLEYTAPGTGPQEILLPLHFPNFDKMRGGEMVFTIVGQQQRTFKPSPTTAERYYTGLQVTRDPGVPVVYAGFITMLIGFVVTFFMAHQMICVDITAHDGQTLVAVAGLSDRNKLGMTNRVAQLARRLQQS